jgi:urease accessory protein
LAFRCVDGATALVAAEARSPLQILAPRRRGPSAWAVLASHGGGLVAGDHLSIEASVGPGAVALLATQAETKVYRAEGGRTARQDLDASVAEGGVLAVLPEPVSAFAGARYAQRQRFDLDAGASLLLVDALVAGRTARGERWALERLRADLEVRVEGRLAAADALLLEPGAPSLLAQRLTRFDAIALVVVLGPAFAGAARALLDAVGARPASPGAALLVSASPLPGGALLRCAAERVEELGAFLRGALTFAAGVLGDDPFQRRW